MLEGDEWKGEYPYQDDEGPEARLNRQYHRHVEESIRLLHNSLPEKSSDLDLFSFTEIRLWGLKHTRKRARGS